MSKRLVALGALFLFSAVAFGVGAHTQAQSPETISLRDRVLIASKIYRIVSTFFPGLSQEKFDAEYAVYLDRILHTENRREFDLTSMEFIADLHDGHSWFYDNWLDQNYGQPIGFIAYPVNKKWVVIRTRIESVKVGDVISTIDGAPIDEFLARNRKYVSASSDRDAGLSFFDTPAIFPERFAVTLSNGRAVTIDRKNDKKKDEPPPKTEGRWLTDGAVAYVKVPSFQGIETQAQALDYFKQFHDAKAVILDVRGNPGLGEPLALQRALMKNPYQTWMESSSMKGGALLRNYSPAYPELSEMTTSGAVVPPREPIYSGRLILLIDRGCSCACEDFVMPFKVSKRAELVGENTAGTFSFTHFTAFENGMLLNIAAVHHTFPDGSQFEGVGIAPDIEVQMNAEDWKAGRDVVLGKALEIASQR
jgi:carboxyl-terminal processing protease